MPVTVIDTIKPQNAADFAIVEDVDFKGGHQTVADHAARDAITAAHRTIGMFVTTQDDGRVWQLNIDLTTWTMVPYSSYYLDNAATAGKNVYTSFDLLYADAIQTAGLIGIFTNSTASQQVIPAGTFDLQRRFEFTGIGVANSCEIGVGAGCILNNPHRFRDTQLIFTVDGQITGGPFGIHLKFENGNLIGSGNTSPVITLDPLGVANATIYLRGETSTINFSGAPVAPIVLVNAGATIDVHLADGAILFAGTIQGSGTLNVYLDFVSQIAGDMVAGGLSGPFNVFSNIGGNNTQVVLGDGTLAPYASFNPHSPGPIGDTTPSTVGATNLTATGTVNLGTNSGTPVIVKGPLSLGIGNPAILSGNGSPEGVVTAVVGSTYQRGDGPPYFYVKETGTGNTGWGALI